MKRRLAIFASLLCVAASIGGAVLILGSEPGFRSASAPATRTIVQPRAQRPVSMHPVTETTPASTSPAATP